MARFSSDDIVKDLVTDRFGRVLKHRGKHTTGRNTYEVRIGPRPIDPVVVRWNSQLRRATLEEAEEFMNAEKKARAPKEPTPAKPHIEKIVDAVLAKR